MIIIKKGEKGFSLVELVLTMAVLLIVMSASYQAFLHYFKINIMTNERAVKSVLATQRVEEWKSVKGENFAPGVAFPIYTPTIASNGVITFNTTVVSIPATTELDFDCTANTAVTQAPGYNYSIIQGSFGNPGGSPYNCWGHPMPRTVGDTTPGDLIFVISCPAGVSSTLELQMVDYATLLRNQRIIINNLVKGSYTSTDLVPPDGKTISLALTSADTSTGLLTIEIEQTGTINAQYSIIDPCDSGATGWSRSPSSISRTIVATPVALPAPYNATDTDAKCLSIYGPGSSGQNIYKNITIPTTAANAGDSLSIFVKLDSFCKCWFTFNGVNSNTVLGSTSAGWQKLTRVLALGDIGSSKQLKINFQEEHGAPPPNTSDTVWINQVMTERVVPLNPNSVLTSFKMRSLIGFTDPDPAGPIAAPSHYPYKIKSTITPTDSIPGAALGWLVTVEVSKIKQVGGIYVDDDKYETVKVSNTINR